MDKPNGLELKYFVLKPKGTDIYAQASRKAMRAYARHVASENDELYHDLQNWAERETLAAHADKSDEQ